MMTLIKRWDPFDGDLAQLDIRTRLGILFCIFFTSGIFGFIYETVFYVFNDGMILRRGTTFGPWIQLYGWGGLLIFFVANTARKKPLAVVLKSGLISGVLEFAVGYGLYHFANGFRGWDYNTEIWNWGNIGGYICFRSVGFFAVSGLMLIYVFVPCFRKLASLLGTRRFFIVSAIPAGLFLIDIFYNDILTKFVPLMNALTFYEQLGWPHK